MTLRQLLFFEVTPYKPLFCIAVLFLATKLACHDFYDSGSYIAPVLLTEINQISIGIRSWISNDIHVKQVSVIIHSCLKFSGALLKQRVE